MKFSNRLEAYLSWISTGIKPDEFDSEPRNTTEYWLNAEAERLDRMSGENRATEGIALRSLVKGTDEKLDYNDLDNKPITLYEEDYEYSAFVQDGTIGNLIHFDITKNSELEAVLGSLSYHDGLATLVAGEFEKEGRTYDFGLAAVDVNMLTAGAANGYCLAYRNDEDNSLIFIYSTTNFNYSQSTSVFKGFQNLNNNGDIATTEGSIVQLNNTGNWNGVIIFNGVMNSNAEEGKYYFTLPEVRHPVKDDEISLDDIANMNKEAFLVDIPNFTYETGGMEAIVTVGSTTPSSGEHDFNVFMGAMKDDLLGEQDEDIILVYMFYAVYASKHKNGSASGPFGSTIYFDENGWVRQIGDTPVTYEMIIEQFGELIQDTKLYYTSDHCDDAFIMEAPSIISQCQHGENKEIAIKEPLYEHQIRVTYNESDLKQANLFFKIITSTSSPMTDKDVYEYFRDSITICDYYPCTGCYNGYNVYGISSYNNLDGRYTLMINFNSNMERLYDSYKTITDNVIELI